MKREPSDGPAPRRDMGGQRRRKTTQEPDEPIVDGFQAEAYARRIIDNFELARSSPSATSPSYELARALVSRRADLVAEALRKIEEGMAEGQRRVRERLMHRPRDLAAFDAAMAEIDELERDGGSSAVQRSSRRRPRWRALGTKPPPAED